MSTLYPNTVVRLLSIGNTKLPERFVGKILQFLSKGADGNDKYLVEFNYLGTRWTVEVSVNDFVVVQDVAVKTSPLPKPLSLSEKEMPKNCNQAVNTMLLRVTDERVYQHPMEHYASYKDFVTDEQYNILKKNYVEFSEKVMAIFKQDLRLALSFFFTEGNDLLFDRAYQYILDTVFENDFVHYEYYLADCVREIAKLISIFSGYKAVKNEQ